MKSIKFTYLFVALLCYLPALTQTNLVSTSTSVLSYPTNVTIQPPSFDVSEETIAGEMYEFAKSSQPPSQFLRAMVEEKMVVCGRLACFRKEPRLLAYYNEFWIPSGGQLYVYNPEQTQVIGPFTSKHNHSSGFLPMNSSKVMRYRIFSSQLSK